MTILRSRQLPGAVALLLILSSGVVHGVWTNRWSTEQAVSVAAEALDVMPLAVGDWEATDETLNTADVQLAELSGYVLRQYAQPYNGRTVSVLLMCGPPGPVAVHPPTACYRGAGYQMQANPRHHSISSSETGPALRDSFLVADFQKSTAVDFRQTRIFWAWSADGHWSVPEHPRIAFAGIPALFKLYVTCDTESGDEPVKGSDAESFLQQLLPELRATVFARLNDVPTVPRRSPSADRPISERGTS